MHTHTHVRIFVSLLLLLVRVTVFSIVRGSVWLGHVTPATHSHVILLASIRAMIKPKAPNA